MADLQRGYIGRDLKESGAPAALLFSALRAANLKRLTSDTWGTAKDWSPNDWMVALVGEVGELANMLKKIRRGSAYPGMKMPTREDIAGELADIQTYLDLLAARLDVDLAEATVRKFNEVSVRWGLDDRL